MELWYPLLFTLINCFYSNVYTLDRPHIVFILADDLGWNDVSYHGSDQIPTPNIDSLGYGGVILNRHYTQPLCTPSRVALMTGKYPIHTGTHWAFYNSQKAGLPLSEKLMPQYLREIGYSTHLVGKWHLGFYKKQFTPLERGFDTHFGYWGGMTSYFDHIGEDLIRTQENESIFSGHDMRRNFDSAWDIVGEYATDLFTKESVRIIENHPNDKPMFLYIAHLAAHAGNQGKMLEAPQEEINRFAYISNPNRRSYAAMVSKLDQSVGDVLEALSKKDMLKNTIVVFVSDNGAPNLGVFRNWGSNFPLRGQKATLWEGALRTPAVIWSPLINKPNRVSNGLMHMTDWLPTLLAAAGHDIRSLEVDGVNQWQAISMNLPSSRDSLVLDIFTHFDMHGLMIDSFKYIRGATPYPHSQTMSNFLNLETIFSKKTPSYDTDKILSSKAWIAVQNITGSPSMRNKITMLRQEATVECVGSFDPLDCDEKPCLFNVMSDPCEQKNIASNYPLLTAHFKTVLNTYKAGLVPDVSLFADPKANPDLFNGTWNIWAS